MSKQEENRVESKEMLLAAVGCSRLPGIFNIAARHSFVVFGAMDEKTFDWLTARDTDIKVSSLPVFFYETG